MISELSVKQQRRHAGFPGVIFVPFPAGVKEPGVYIAMAWALIESMGWGGKDDHMILKNLRIPMNLQIFAEGDGTDPGQDGNTPGGNGGAGQQQSFDDFLSEGGNQAEFDRRVQKAVNTALSKAQEKWKILTDDKVSEADKLAKMTKEEKAQYLQQKKEKELSDRESEVTRRELMAEAKNTLAEKKLPAGLAQVLDYTDADACNKSIETVEKAFRESVQSAVEERLKGDKPPKIDPGQGADLDLAKQVEAAMKGTF